MVDRERGQVDVAFTIAEGAQSVDRRHRRRRATRRPAIAWCASSSKLAPSQPLDLGALSRSRRNLYDTGAFSVVDITREDLEGDAPAGSRAPPANGRSHRQRTDTEAGAGQRGGARGAAVPAALRRVVRHRARRRRHPRHLESQLARQGARASACGRATTAQLREARLYISQPSLRYWPLETTANRLLPRGAQPDHRDHRARSTSSRKGVSIQQERELAQRLRLELRLPLRARAHLRPDRPAGRSTNR